MGAWPAAERAVAGGPDTSGPAAYTQSVPHRQLGTESWWLTVARIGTNSCASAGNWGLAAANEAQLVTNSCASAGNWGLAAANEAQLVQLALTYSPGTRALPGALLEHLEELPLARRLQESLSPLTSFCLGLSAAALPHRDQ